MNLAHIIDPHPDASVALRHSGDGVTYGQLRQRAAATRAALGRVGVAAGDRVALVFPTAPSFAVAYFAALSAGSVAVPLNPESPIAELASELGTVRASVVLLGGPRAADLAGPIGELGYLVLALDEDGLPPDLEADGADGAGGETRTAGGTGDGEADWASGIADRDPDDTAVLLFTSGTAGSPKAAMLTHGGLRANIDQMSLAVGLAVTPEDVGLLVVPPFHIYGLNAVLGIHLAAGGSLAMMERFEPAAVLDLCASEGVTVLPGVPQLFAALVRHPGARGDELAGLRIAVSGAAPLALEVAQDFEHKFGVPIWQAYGLTEASPSVTFPDVYGPRHPMSVGVPLPGIEVRIVDGDGHLVEHGDPGEILVRGPNVFAGYFEDQHATRGAVDRGGWLHTGDVGVMDEDGVITIVDRNKDLVIVSGFNVFPAEVEHVLEQHPAVEEAVIVGVPDPVQGESVRAFVVPAGDFWPAGADAPRVTEADLIDFCARHLARYKCPSAVVFARQLPRGMQGKVLRRVLV